MEATKRSWKIYLRKQFRLSLDFQHFIITRFNLGHRDWKTTQSGNQVGSDEWLNHRFDLFENFCLPSVRNQHQQNFTWIILFDENTPNKFREKINEIANSYDLIQVLYSDGFPQQLPTLHEFISKKTQTDFVITTRLDNDDLIHKDFVETIQSLYQPKKDLVIDLRTGYQTSIKGRFYESRLYKEDPFNPFISVVEAVSDFNTVMAKRHAQWAKTKSLIINKEKPLWIELVHDENKSNVEKRHMRLVRNVAYDEFGLDKDIPKYSKKYELLNNFPLTRTMRALMRMYNKHVKATSKNLN